MSKRIKRIKRILSTVGFLAVFLTYGALGGLENGNATLAESITLIIIGVVVLVLCIRTNSWIDGELQRRTIRGGRPSERPADRRAA